MGISRRLFSLTLRRRLSNLPPIPLSESLRNLEDPPLQHSNVDVSNICGILATTQSAEAALDRVGFGASEPLVAGVLKRLSNSGSLAMAFFKWAQRQEGFQHTTETYNALIEALGKIRQFKKMWELVDDMKAQNLLSRETFALISRRYARAKMVDEAVKTFEIMDTKFGFKLEVSDFNRMLDVLCKSRCVERAQKVFDEMRVRRFKPDIKSYTILLEGWGQSLNLLRLKEVCEEMKDEGFEFDVVAYGIVINAHCKARKCNEAIEIFRAMEAKGCKPSPHIFCTMIIGLGSAGRLKEALEFFGLSKASGLPPEAPTYNAVVGAYCWSGKTEDALRVVGEMKALGIGPNSRTYDIIMHRLVKARKKEEAFEIFERMGQEPGCEPTVSTYAIMVRMFCDEGRVEMAVRVWDQMRSKGVIPGMHLFSTLINGLRRERKLEEACKYFEEMMAMGIRPPARLFGDFKQALLDQGRDDIVKALNEKIERFRKNPLV